MTPEKMNQAFAKCLEPLARHYDDQPPAELPEKLKKSTRRTHFADGFHPHDVSDLEAQLVALARETMVEAVQDS